MHVEGRMNRYRALALFVSVWRTVRTCCIIELYCYNSKVLGLWYGLVMTYL